jgi:hypothetical protein
MTLKTFLFKGSGLRYCMRFGVLIEVTISIVMFWVMAPRGRAGGYERFGGTYCLRVQGSYTEEIR